MSKSVFVTRSKMILPCVVSCAFFLCVAQANLDIIFDDAVCNVENTEFIGPDCVIDILEDSEDGNYLTVHLEIKKKVPVLVGSAIVLGMEKNGEYTQDVGLSLKMDICETLAGPPNIAHVFAKALNLKSSECPPEPGVFGNDHFVISGDGSSGLPDSFPDGKYFLNMTILHEDKALVMIGIYVTVM